MRIDDLDIPGPKHIKLHSYRDERGFFVERYQPHKIAKLGLELPDFIQDNFSRSHPRVLRGIHAQYNRPQAKLVTCLAGRILDFAVDLRASSPYFGRSVSVELCGDEPSWLWIPKGFGHAFVVLGETEADVLYKVDAPYNPGGEIGIRWNDPDLKIPWGKFLKVSSPILSDKDKALMTFAEYSNAPLF